MKLGGKVAIVTGSGRGIGRAIALRLAQDGADVVVCDIDAGTAESTASEITKMGRRALPVQVDVAKRAEAERLVARAIGEFGHVDVLVNNAGIAQIKPWLELTEDDIDRTFAVNTKGIIFLCQAIAQHIMERRRGRIVNIASLAAKLPQSRYLDYSASKAAVINITRALATYFAPYNVTVNSMVPGVIDTKMWELVDTEFARLEGWPRGEQTRRRLERIPLGRLGQPEDIANVVAFLASDDSSYMTGQSLNVEGGIFME